MAKDIKEKLPEEFDLYAMQKQIEVPSPTQIVLLQEVERFNKLL